MKYNLKSVTWSGHLLNNNLLVSIMTPSSSLDPVWPLSPLGHQPCVLCTITWHQPRAAGDVTAEMLWGKQMLICSHSQESLTVTRDHDIQTLSTSWTTSGSLTVLCRTVNNTVRDLSLADSSWSPIRALSRSSMRRLFLPCKWQPSDLNPHIIMSFRKSEASNPNVEKYLPNVTSFTENRLELDFLLTPENR